MINQKKIEKKHTQTNDNNYVHIDRMPIFNWWWFRKKKISFHIRQIVFRKGSLSHSHTLTIARAFFVCVCSRQEIFFFLGAHHITPHTYIHCECGFFLVVVVAAAAAVVVVVVFIVIRWFVGCLFGSSSSSSSLFVRWNKQNKKKIRQLWLSSTYRQSLMTHTQTDETKHWWKWNNNTNKK